MWAMVLLMYLMNTALWIIDIHNIVGELDITLISSTGGSLDQRYTKSVDSVLKLSLAIDVLYAFMVCHPLREDMLTPLG
jgi:energy-converting hydrogenase Eha subunit F